MSALELSLLFNVWAESCEKFAVIEHPADEEVSQTHCHFLMINCKFDTPEALKRRFQEIYPTETRKGNALWAWTHKDPVDETFLNYMVKGEYAINFSKNISKEEVEKARLSWKTTTPVPAKEPKNLGEFALLLKAAKTAIKANKLSNNMPSIKCFIKSHYLRAERAVPRTSDTNRYAYSIYAIASGLTQEADMEKLDRQALIDNIEF